MKMRWSWGADKRADTLRITFFSFFVKRCINTLILLSSGEINLECFLRLLCGSLMGLTPHCPEGWPADPRFPLPAPPLPALFLSLLPGHRAPSQHWPWLCCPPVILSSDGLHYLIEESKPDPGESVGPPLLVCSVPRWVLCSCSTDKGEDRNIMTLPTGKIGDKALRNIDLYLQKKRQWFSKKQYVRSSKIACLWHNW